MDGHPGAWLSRAKPPAVSGREDDGGKPLRPRAVKEAKGLGTRAANSSERLSTHSS